MGFDKFGNGRIIEAMQQQAPQIAVAAPMNDVQLVALVAAQRPGLTAAEAVTWSSEIVFEALIQAPRLQEKIRKHRATDPANGAS